MGYKSAVNGTGGRGPGDRSNPKKFCNGRRRGWRTETAKWLGLLDGIDRASHRKEWDRALRDRRVDASHPQIEPGSELLRIASDVPDLYCSRTPGWGTDHTGVGRCRRCGGKTPVGPENPAYKSGEYSRNDWLLREIEDVDAGRAVGDLRRQIQSCDYREQQLYRVLEAGADSPPLRSAMESGLVTVKKARDGLRVAISTNDLGLFDSSITLLDTADGEWTDALKDTQVRTDAWAEVRRVQDHKRKLSATLVRNEVHGHDVIHREFVEALAGRMVSVVTSTFDEFIDDPEKRRAAARRVVGGLSPFLTGAVAGDQPWAERVINSR